MFKLPNTLTFRLTLWYTAAFTAFLAAAFVLLFVSIHSILLDRMNDDLLEDMEEYTLLLAKRGLEHVIQESEREAASNDNSHFFIRLFTHSGKPLFSSDLTHWQGLDDASTMVEALSSQTAPKPQRKQQMEALIQTVKLPSQEYAARSIYGFITKRRQPIPLKSATGCCK